MNVKVKRSLYLVGVLIVLYVMQQMGALGDVISTIGAMPFWVILVITGILVSFWQFLKHSNNVEELEAEDENWIEEQGSVYIRRIAEERERRNKNQG